MAWAYNILSLITHTLLTYLMTRVSIPDSISFDLRTQSPKLRPTGVAIIEFSQEEPVGRAVALPPPFNEILGQPVQAKRADAQVPKKDPGPKRTLTRQQFTQQVRAVLKGGDVGFGSLGHKCSRFRKLIPKRCGKDGIMLVAMFFLTICRDKHRNQLNQSFFFKEHYFPSMEIMDSKNLAPEVFVKGDFFLSTMVNHH